MICKECRTCPIEDLCDEADRVIDERLSLDGEHDLLLAIYEKGRADALKEAFDKTYTKAYDSGYEQAEKEHKAMCETCIHKVSAEDVRAIRNSAIDEYFSQFDEFVKSNPKLTYFWTEFQVEARRIAERMKEHKNE